MPVVKEYTEAMKKYKPGVDTGFVSLEGYLVGKLFCMAAEKVSGDLTRENLIKAVQDTGTFDLGGITLKFGSNDHQGMDDVYLTVIKGDKIEPLK